MTASQTMIPAQFELRRAHGACDYATLGGILRPRPARAAEALGGAVLGSASVRRVVGLGLLAPLDSAGLAAIEAEQEGFGGALELSVAAPADASVRAAAASRGFEVVEQECVVAADPRALDLARSPIDVRRVAPSEAAVWAAVHRRTFGLPLPTPGEVDDLDRPLLAHPGVECHLAWLGGEPVGAGAMMVSGDLATFFATGTCPESRGRGVHHALLAARLRRAVDLGVRWVVMAVVPESASLRNLRRHGLDVAYPVSILRREGDRAASSRA